MAKDLSMSYDLNKIINIIVSAATEELLPRFTKVKRQEKSDGSLLTEADIATQEYIAKQLQVHWPETLFFGEEMTAEKQAECLRSNQEIWCLDPLDGTSNFAAGIPYFCISLSLIKNGQVILGVVYDPLRKECFSASLSDGATLNNQPLIITNTELSLKQAIAIIDFKRLSPELANRLVCDSPYASQRSFGSVALDWCWLASGRGHVYLHGSSNIWDYSAGNFIFTMAGGHSCTLDGETIFVNELKPRSSVAAVDKNLFKKWIEWIGIHS